MDTTKRAYFRVGSEHESLGSVGTKSMPVNRIGFWSAVLATIFSIGYGITVIVVMISTLGWSIIITTVMFGFLHGL